MRFHAPAPEAYVRRDAVIELAILERLPLDGARLAARDRRQLVTQILVAGRGEELHHPSGVAAASGSRAA